MIPFRKTFAFLADKLLVKEKHNNFVLELWRKHRCEHCPSNKYDSENIQCKACGCLLDIKWKAKTNKATTDSGVDFIELTHCELGHWADSDIADYYKSLKSQQ